MRASIVDLLAGWDGECVVTRFDAATGTWMFVAIHDTTLGPAAGGTRMQVYPTAAQGLADALRLAEGMTYKWAGVGLDQGGGKAVLAVDHPLDESELSGLLTRYGRVLESLDGAFSTGPDIGMGPERMAEVSRHTRFVVGAVDGDAPDPGVFTAHGVKAGIEAASRVVLGVSDLRGVRVLVQGLGDVGAPLARGLAESGADLLLADVDDRRVERLADRLAARVIDPADVYDTPCEVYAPCALGGSLNADTIARLECQVVAGSANNQFATVDDAGRAHRAGIVVVPDYIINAGGAFAVTRMSQGVRQPAVLMDEVSSIGPRVAEILAAAVRDGVPPLAAAQARVDLLLAERGSPRYG